ncbi:MAG TPA: hypothetical protein VIU12_21875 [Chryseolinea sp.]
MRQILNKTYSILSQLPLGEDLKTTYKERASHYFNACGCSSGGIFLVAATLGYVPYWIFVNPSLKALVYGLFFVFVTSLFGKLVGITVARVKLFILYKTLLKKQHYVNLHEMGRSTGDLL